MSDDWLIRKNGAWYRPSCQGYTTDLTQAGLYSESAAKARANEPGVDAVPLAEAVADVDVEITRLTEKIEALQAVKARVSEPQSR